MLKFEIENEKPKEKTLKAKLTISGDGTLELSIAGYYVLGITTQGNLELYGYLPPNLGFIVDEHRKIQIKD